MNSGVKPVGDPRLGAPYYPYHGCDGYRSFRHRRLHPGSTVGVTDSEASPPHHHCPPQFSGHNFPRKIVGRRPLDELVTQTHTVTAAAAATALGQWPLPSASPLTATAAARPSLRIMPMVAAPSVAFKHVMPAVAYNTVLCEQSKGARSLVSELQASSYGGTSVASGLPHFPQKRGPLPRPFKHRVHASRHDFRIFANPCDGHLPSGLGQA
jgi:hypothetical protein